MSKRNLGEKIKLTTYDDMFEVDENVVTPQQEQIIEVPLLELHAFAKHPFKVLEDEKMEEMIASVKEYGILVPAIARVRGDGGYELISGHRRQYAAIKAGIETMPVMIRECTDDQATVIMVDANIQREDITISEKAKAYRMKYDAMKHQGSSGGLSLEEMSNQVGESCKTIQRLIYLSNLTDELLELIDTKKIGVAQGGDLAQIPLEAQEIVYKVMVDCGVFVNMEQSARIKNAVKEGLFNEQWLREILSYKKMVARKVVFNQKRLDSYFEPNMSNADIEHIIVKLLEEWKTKGGVN